MRGASSAYLVAHLNTFKRMNSLPKICARAAFGRSLGCTREQVARRAEQTERFFEALEGRGHTERA
jgi:hypothetical protein